MSHTTANTTAVRAWLSVAALVLGGCGKQTSERPNVLLISVDSLRADHLGCYGYERETSPSIDALAREGTLFERVRSSTSWTLPSHASLFTALPDSVHGCDRNSRILAGDRTTLAETLAAAGYATAGFWSGPYLHPRFGLAQGFEHYQSCASYETYSQDDLRAGRTSRAGAAPTGQLRADALSHEDITSPRLVDAFSTWLDGRDERPFFAFVHMWDVHYDYIPPSPFDEMFDPDYEGSIDGRNLGSNKELRERELAPRDLEHLVALYDGEIAWTDRHIGRILEHLDELELAESTLVVLTADHGEEFFEHGKFGHKKTLFDESIRIPLVVRYPKTVPANRRVRAEAAIVDVAPTILELADVRGLDHTLGSSLVGLLDGAGTGVPRVTYSELYRRHRQDYLVSAQSADWKLVFDRRNGEPLGLWNLSADPGEQSDLLQSDARLRGEAERALREFEARCEELREHHPKAREEARGMPSDLEEQLRSLGYIGEE